MSRPYYESRRSPTERSSSRNSRDARDRDRDSKSSSSRHHKSASSSHRPKSIHEVFGADDSDGGSSDGGEAATATKQQRRSNGSGAGGKSSGSRPSGSGKSAAKSSAAAAPEATTNEELGDLLSQLASFTKDYEETRGGRSEPEELEAISPSNSPAPPAVAENAGKPDKTQQAAPNVSANSNNPKSGGSGQVQYDPAIPPPVSAAKSGSGPVPGKSVQEKPSEEYLNSVLQSMGMSGDVAKEVMQRLMTMPPPSESGVEQQPQPAAVAAPNPVVSYPPPASVVQSSAAAQPNVPPPPVMYSAPPAASAYQQQYYAVQPQQQQMAYQMPAAQQPAVYYQQMPAIVPPPAAVAPPQQPSPPGASKPFQGYTGVSRPPPSSGADHSISPDKDKQWLQATKDFERQLSAKDKESLKRGGKHGETVEKQLSELRAQRQSFSETAHKLRNELDRLKRQHAELQRKAARSAQPNSQSSLLDDNHRLQSEIIAQLRGREESLKQLDDLLAKFDASAGGGRSASSTTTAKDDKTDKKGTSPRRSSSKSRKKDKKESNKKKKKRARSQSSSSSSAANVSSGDESTPQKALKKPKIDPDSVEPKLPVDDAHRCIYFDPGSHWCRVCNTSYSAVEELFAHLHSTEHSQKNDRKKRPWINKAVKAETSAQEQAAKDASISQMMPLQGSEFVLPVTGFFCMLCEQFSGDVDHALVHVKTPLHRKRYMELLQRTPTYERDYNSAKMSALLKQSTSTVDKVIMPADYGDMRIGVKPGGSQKSSDERRVQRKDEHSLQIKVTQSVDAASSSGKKSSPSEKSGGGKSSSNSKNKSSSSSNQSAKHADKKHDVSSSKSSGGGSKHHQHESESRDPRLASGQHQQHDASDDRYGDRRGPARDPRLRGQQQQEPRFTSALDSRPTQKVAVKGTPGYQPPVSKQQQVDNSVRIAQAIERQLQQQATAEDILLLRASGAMAHLPSAQAQVAQQPTNIKTVQVHLPQQQQQYNAYNNNRPIDARLG